MLDALLAATRPSEVLFWSGAGLSAEAPTNGPLGAALTRRAVGAYFEPSTWDRLQDLYARLKAPNAKYRPRLETVLDVLVGAYGLNALGDVLSDLADAAPNRNHRFFAQHVKDGGMHVTANFDTCIERAAGEEKHRPSVLHIHGKIEADGVGNDIERLGARLSVIENGFPPDLTSSLDALLADARRRLIVFVGYSGSDFFDATPYLRSRFIRLTDRQLLWWWHASEHDSVSSGADVATPLLQDAHRAGVPVMEVTAPLPALLSTLAARWGYEYPPPAAGPPPRPWVRVTPVSSRSRAAATALLYGRMGLRADIIAALEPLQDRRGDENALLADAYWGAGRYRDALAAWRRVYAAADPDTRTRLDERTVAVHWIRGQLLAAERRGWRLLQRTLPDDAGITDDTRAVVAELYLRVTTHMRRLPDLRWLVRRTRVKTATTQLDHLKERLAGREGIQLRARLGTAASATPPDSKVSRPHHSDAMAESEALHGWLNYRHGELRAAADEARAGRPELISPESYWQLHDAHAAIGATGDAARVPLISGATAAFTPVDVASGFRGVDVTRWHVLRLVGLFTTRWAVDRRRAIRSRRR